jgi:protein involved in polysaccharide export with SLBB domain
LLHGALVTSVLLVLAGCVSSKTTPLGETASAFAAADGPPQVVLLPLAAGDKVRVTVYGEDRISGEYQIDPDGMIALPLAGTVKAAGLTKPALEAALADKLAGRYLRNPKVTVDVVNFRPFYVLGEVQKPGEYPFRSGLNVLSAIAIAGGTTYRANTSKVYIQRFGSTELTELAQSPTISVMPGDVVRVPERYF